MADNAASNFIEDHLQGEGLSENHRFLRDTLFLLNRYIPDPKDWPDDRLYNAATACIKMLKIELGSSSTLARRCEELLLPFENKYPATRS